MLVGGIAVAVVVVIGMMAAVIRRRSHDDDHSVEHYHRQLHTLQEMRAHTREVGDGAAEASQPASVSTVRLTDPGRTVAPPPLPPRVDAEEPLAFDDEAEPIAPSRPPPPSPRKQRRAMEAMDRRPRRLAGPLVAIVVVAALVALLIVSGVHKTSSTHHSAPGGTTATTHPHTAAQSISTSTSTSTTTTTAPPTVSAPQSTSAYAATYRVSASAYSLAVAATSGRCWVDVTNTSNGAVLFSSTLEPGQSHTVAATGPVIVIAGAAGSFSATVNGTAVSIPPGFQSPFTLSFVTPAATT